MGFCSCTLKLLLVVFNLACGIAGLAILIVGVMSNYHGGSFKEFISGQVTTVSICLMVLGGVVFLIAFFGCCGALREDTCMIQTYGVILLAILLIEVAIGVTAFVYKSKVETGFQNNLKEFFKDYNNDKDSKKAIDDLQTSLQCCGYDGPEFWGQNIPSSCCKAQKNCDVRNSYQEGCYKSIKEAAKHILGLVGGVAIGIAVIELIGVICAFYVASSIKRAERRGYA